MELKRSACQQARSGRQKQHCHVYVCKLRAMEKDAEGMKNGGASLKGMTELRI